MCKFLTQSGKLKRDFKQLENLRENERRPMGTHSRIEERKKLKKDGEGQWVSSSQQNWGENKGRKEEK